MLNGRLQQRRQRGLFGPRGNRRTRPTPLAVPAPAPAARPRLGPRLRRAAAAAVRRLRAALKLAAALLLAAALGACVWAGYRAVLRSPRFVVREVLITPTHHLDPALVGALVDIEPGRSIFALDLARVRQKVAAQPWVARVEARRELPHRVVIDIAEREPALLVELGGLYLCDQDGHVFKRAETVETAGLVVVTGIEREAYLSDRARAEDRLRAALELLRRYQSGPHRPPLGEIHLEPESGVTLYTANGAAALHLGDGDLAATLNRFDLVWRALGSRQALARAIHLENRTRPDRVTLKLDPEPGAGRPRLKRH